MDKAIHVLRFAIENWGLVGGFLLGYAIGTSLHLGIVVDALPGAILGLVGLWVQEKVHGRSL